ncbi:hypothetical protein [Accumulibacter sp.]|nr:hypothetical protein [Accumulibacter sp.]HNB66932.1 hypothetical protein [Accumulibacter sp.]
MHPHLLRHLMPDRPNRVSAAEIADLVMRRRFLYLFVAIDRVNTD